MKKCIFIIPLMALLLTGCKQQELLKGLDQRQANEVVALLQHNNILAEKKLVNKEGYIVSVDRADFAASVDLMSIYDLPTRPRIEIAQMFPADSLVSSPGAERARLYSAIEQRLEQSLLNLQGVVKASVHVSYNQNTGEGRNKVSPTHISALLKYDNAVKDPTLLINDTRRFLKNSLDNVSYDDISVVLSPVTDIQRFTPTVQVDKGLPFTVWLSISAGIILLILAAVFMLFSRRYQQHIPKKLQKYIPAVKEKDRKTSAEKMEVEDAAGKN